MKMCKVFKVSRSAFHEWLDRPRTQREEADLLLAEAIKTFFYESDRSYGHRRIKKQLRKKGIKSSNDRIRRLMKKRRLAPVQTRKFKATTNSKHSLPVAPNLLRQDFQAFEPCQKWVGDITYIHIRKGWLYLGTVIDLFSRKVVGWALVARMNKELVLKAMRQAIQHERPSDGLIFHSDRGSQYASYDFQDLLHDNKILQSMSAKGDCYDNACAESFFTTIKKELVLRRHFATRREAELVIINYMASWYNSKRIHSYLDDLSPLEFEEKYYENLCSAA